METEKKEVYNIKAGREQMQIVDADELHKHVNRTTIHVDYSIKPNRICTLLDTISEQLKEVQ